MFKGETQPFSLFFLILKMLSVSSSSSLMPIALSRNFYNDSTQHQSTSLIVEHTAHRMNNYEKKINKLFGFFNYDSVLLFGTNLMRLIFKAKFCIVLRILAGSFRAIRSRECGYSSRFLLAVFLKINFSFCDNSLRIGFLRLIFDWRLTSLVDHR